MRILIFIQLFTSVFFLRSSAFAVHYDHLASCIDYKSDIALKEQLLEKFKYVLPVQRNFDGADNLLDATSAASNEENKEEDKKDEWEKLEFLEYASPCTNSENEGDVYAPRTDGCTEGSIEDSQISRSLLSFELTEPTKPTDYTDEWDIRLLVFKEICFESNKEISYILKVRYNFKHPDPLETAVFSVIIPTKSERFLHYIKQDISLKDLEAFLKQRAKGIHAERGNKSCWIKLFFLGGILGCVAAGKMMPASDSAG